MRLVAAAMRLLAAAMRLLAAAMRLLDIRTPKELPQGPGLGRKGISAPVEGLGHPPAGGGDVSGLGEGRAANPWPHILGRRTAARRSASRPGAAGGGRGPSCRWDSPVRRVTQGEGVGRFRTAKGEAR